MIEKNEGVLLCFGAVSIHRSIKLTDSVVEEAQRFTMASEESVTDIHPLYVTTAYSPYPRI